MSMNKKRLYKGETLEDRKNKRKLQFMTAGHELFGTIGFRQTTVRLLCKEAKLTDRYFYESFTDIENLLEIVYLSEIKIIKDKLTEVSLNVIHLKDSDLILNVTLNAYFDVVQDPKIARIVWLEVLGVSNRIDRLYNAAYQEFALFYKILVKSIYPDTKLNDKELDILALGVIGAVSQVTMAWLLSDYKLDRNEIINSMTYLIRSISASFENNNLR